MIALNGHAFTSIQTFQCGILPVYDTIVVKSFLMPDLSRFSSASSVRYGELKDCQSRYDTLENGDVVPQNCYSNEHAYFSSYGKQGILLIRDSDRAYIICELIEDIQ